MQKALYLVFVLLVLGGILFILAALWIVPEKQTVDRSVLNTRCSILNKTRSSFFNIKMVTKNVEYGERQY